MSAATVGSWTGTGTGSSTSGAYLTITSSSTTSITYSNAIGVTAPQSVEAWKEDRRAVLRRGKRLHLTLPDGAVLTVDRAGNYRLDDKNAQVVYKGNTVRDFNRFINASDILEDFIGFVGGLGVRRGELMKIPVEAFIQFLIVRAAQEDGEDADLAEVAQHPALLPAPPVKKSPRCGLCGRFVRSASPMPYCNASHAAQFAQKVFARKP